MKNVYVLAILASMVQVAEAGEFRGVLGYGIGSAEFEDDAGDEISGDVSQVVLSGTYYLDEAGPFFGLGLAQVEVGDLEFNGSSLGVRDQESDDTSFTVGYRGGKYGEPQFFVSATLGRSDSDDGDDEDSTTFSVGVEKSTQGGRYELSAGYSAGDDIDTYGVGVAGIVYLNEQFGVGATAGYSMGDGTLLGTEVDVTSWSIGVGVEFRLLN